MYTRFSGFNLQNCPLSQIGQIATHVSSIGISRYGYRQMPVHLDIGKKEKNEKEKHLFLERERTGKKEIEMPLEEEEERCPNVVRSMSLPPSTFMEEIPT